MTSPLNKRRKSREILMQALYQWSMAGQDFPTIEAQFYAEHDPEKFDQDYFRQGLRAVLKDAAGFDGLIEPHIDRALTSLDPISLAILRLGVFELRERPDIPFRVVINEGINLAKRFGPTDSDKYINGVLDKVAPTLRAVEVRALRGG
jgi:transcription antitermination protein NusB